jgi:transposase
MPRFRFQFSERFNKESFLKFIKRMVTHAEGRKIFLIVDNARYHHAKIVSSWVEQNSEKIELCFLPPYSPNLNPQENVWRITKRTATHNRHFPELSMLHSTVQRRFNRFQGNPRSLRGAVNRYLPKAS